MSTRGMMLLWLIYTEAHYVALQRISKPRQALIGKDLKPMVKPP